MDDITPNPGTTVTWNMFTGSEAEIVQLDKILLSRDGKEMSLEVLEPANAELYVLPAEGGEGEAENPGYVRVGFTAELKALNDYKLHVVLRPLQ